MFEKFKFWKKPAEPEKPASLMDGFESRSEEEAKEFAEKKEASMDKISKDPKAVEAVRMALEEKGEEGIKIGEKMMDETKEGMSVEESETLLEARGVALESMKEAEKLMQFFKDGKLFNKLAPFCPEISKLQDLVGAENLDNLFDKDFFIALIIKDPAKFAELKSDVEDYQIIESWIKELDAEIQGFAKEFSLPFDKIVTISRIEDQQKREDALRVLLKENLPKGYIAYDRSNDVKEEFKKRGILEKIETFWQLAKEAKNALGKRVSSLRESRPEVAAKPNKRITNFAAGREKDAGIIEDVGFEEAKGILADKENRQKQWDDYLAYEAEQEGIEKDNFNSWRRGLSVDKRDQFKSKFMNEKTFAGKGKGLWRSVLEGLINFVK